MAAGSVAMAAGRRKSMKPSLSRSIRVISLRHRDVLFSASEIPPRTGSLPRMFLRLRRKNDSCIVFTQSS